MRRVTRWTAAVAGGALGLYLTVRFPTVAGVIGVAGGALVLLTLAALGGYVLGVRETEEKYRAGLAEANRLLGILQEALDGRGDYITATRRQFDEIMRAEFPGGAA